MKRYLLLLLLFCSEHLFAQTSIYPIPNATQFDSFINNRSIEWAMYVNDTIRFNNPNLSVLLIDLMKAGKIKTATFNEDDRKEANDIHYTSVTENEKALRPIPIIDSTGMTIGNKNLNNIDSSTYNLSAIEQILYIKDGKLISYIPWASPEISVYTTSNVYIGNIPYFTTCFNFTYDFIPSPKDDIKPLGQTKKRINSDSIKKDDKLKELYGKNLLETLWPYYLKKKISLYSIKSGKQIPPDNFMDFIIADDSIQVPSIEDEPWSVGVRKPTIELNDIFFKDVEITENWFYDATQNIIFCKIPELSIYQRKWVNGNSTDVTIPYLKLRFN
jgi:hypothetical protein